MNGPARGYPREIATTRQVRADKGWFDRFLDSFTHEGGMKDSDWELDAQRAYLMQRPLRARRLLYSIGAVVIALLVWSAFAEVDEVARGAGQVVPSRKVQVIQSQDGGVVSEIRAREADVVEQGDLLIRLDQTRSQSNLRENQAEYLALAMKAARLRALAEDIELQPAPEFLEKIPEVVSQEMALYHSRQSELLLEQEIAEQQLQQKRKELEEALADQKHLSLALDLSQQEMNLTRPMVASGAVSQVEILRLEKEVNRLTGERAQAQAKMRRLESGIGEAENKLKSVRVEFMNETRTELASTLSRMNALREAGLGLSDRVKQTEIRSPVNGTVKRLFANTVGGVVLPGKDLIEIVPRDDSLLVEARINPRDIAFLVPGQSAQVKISAYDFAVYGGLEGVVEHIGADTVMDRDGQPSYIVQVRTRESQLRQDMPIMPGMTVEVDILTGKKSVLAYFLRPVQRAGQMALTER